MARRAPDEFDRKKSARDDKALEQEKEKQDQERELQQDQQQTRDAAQDAFGNEAVQQMMGVVSTKAGEAGQGADLAARKDSGEIGVDYGGDDLPADAPITMEDLVRSWNPTTKRGQDAEPFQEVLGTEDLPAPDPTVAEAMGPLPDLRPREALFLTSRAAETDPSPLVRTAIRLAGGTPLARAWGSLLAPTRAPLLDERVVVVRARTLAFATLLAESACEIVPPAERPALRQMFRFLLELSCRGRILADLLDHVATTQQQLPKAAELVAPGLAALADRTGSGASPSVEQIEHLRQTTAELTPRVSATTLVPELPATAPHRGPDEDDPLGLDAILGQGHRPDPVGEQLDTLLASAEKLAVACSRMRVEGSACLLAVVSVLGADAVAPLLRRSAEELDAELGKVLQLLVEVARAIQQRAVPPTGVRNGLRRGAKGIDLAWTQFCGWLAGAVAGTVPPPGALTLPPLPPDDALAHALAEGRLDLARDAVRAGDLDGAVARMFLTPAGRSGPEREERATEMRRISTLARTAARPALARATELLSILEAPPDGPRTLGAALRIQQDAFASGDDLSFAVVTQVLLDLTARQRPERVRAQQIEACRRLHPLGPTAGYEVLLRYGPPETEDEPRMTVAVPVTDPA